MLALKTKNQHFTSNPSPVALLFKDVGSLANHPLSFHPQGVFGSQENRRKGEKMEQKKKSRKNPTQQLCIQQSKNPDRSTRFHLSLYSAQISKNAKISLIPIIHEWKMGKITKRKSNGRSTEQKKTRKCRSTFALCANFAPFCEATQFSSFFYSSFLLVSDLQC